MIIPKKYRHGLIISDINSYVAKCVDAYGEYAENEVAVLGKLISPGNLILDINADIGYYSVCFSRMTKRNGTVLAFEPSNEKYKYLISNIALNSLANVYPSQLDFNKDFGIDDLGIHSCKLIHFNQEITEKILSKAEDTIKKGKPILYTKITLTEPTKLKLLSLDYLFKKIDIELYNPTNYYGQNNITHDTKESRWICYHKDQNQIDL